MSGKSGWCLPLSWITDDTDCANCRYEPCTCDCHKKEETDEHDVSV